jgi:hypothetical protein
MEREAKPNVQGEGDYEAARRYRKRQKNYQESNDVGKAAVRAAPQSSEEAQSMKVAEDAGKSRAKEEDPAVRRKGSGTRSSS